MADVWRVVPDGNRTGWSVELPDGNTVDAFTLREDAVKFARRQAVEARGTVEIHGADRRLEATINYEDA